MTDWDDRISAQLALCQSAPKTPGPRVVLARLLLSVGRAAEAVAAAEAALALDPRNPAARAARKAAIEAIEALDPALAKLELAAVLSPEDARIALDLGHAYVQFERAADAERSFKRALALDVTLAAAHAALGALYLSVGIEAGAEHHSRLALDLEPAQAIASQTCASILEARGEVAAARECLDAAYERQSLFVEPAADNQLTVLVLASQSSGNIPYRHLMPARRYSRLIWYMEHAHEAQAALMPPYDLVFNAIGDPDLAAPSAAPVRRFLASCQRPVLNPPDKVACTHRHLTPRLLGDLADVVVPNTIRLEASPAGRPGMVAAAAEAGLTLPVLVRPIGSHGGKGLKRADTAEALAGLDARFDGQDVYLTAYRDYRSADGRFRKGRMIFVDRRPYPYHWAVCDDWLAHYESAGMDGDPERRVEERRFLADPVSVIGARAAAAVAAIGARMDLDYCGLDFSVLADGRLLVFEANATMLVHPEAEAGEFAYKNAAVSRIVEAFQARLAEVAAA